MPAREVVLPVEHPEGLALAVDPTAYATCPKYPRFHLRPVRDCLEAPGVLAGYPAQVPGAPCPYLVGWAIQEYAAGEGPKKYIGARPFCGHPRPLQVARIHVPAPAPAEPAGTGA